MKTRILVLAAAMLTVTSLAQAQTADGWIRKVKAGKAIFVTTITGEEIAGRAGPIETGTITVLTATGSRVVPVADVQKVQQHDRPWTGAVAGVVLGAGTALMGIASVCERGPARDSVRDPSCNFKNIVAGFTVYSGVPTLIGWGVDMLVKKRRTIYDARRGSQASLVIGRRLVGVTISF